MLARDAWGRGTGGIVFAESAGFWRAGSPVPPPVVVLTPESHGRLTRLVERGIPVKVELDVDVELEESDREAANVIAELPGGSKADEIVMLGAHLDSWHGGTGATDNAAGCAVMLEAMRILKTLDLKPDRTIRLALWTGEEQGIFGSRAYVKRHFADPVTMQLQPEHAKLAAYFNVDNGTGKIRGVYLQGNDMVRPVFDAWLAPFADLGARTLTIRNTHGTDHLAVRRGRPARLPVHPGPGRVRHAHAPLEPGRLRPRPARGPDAGGRDRRVVRLPRGHPQGEAAAQAAAEAAARAALSASLTRASLAA